MEEKVIEWVKAWINKSGVDELAVAGGVFMNVKLNQKILELTEVNSLFVVPSGADESTAVGAAAFGYLKLCEQRGITPKFRPSDNLYLGNSYSQNQVEEFLKEGKYFDKFNIENLPDDDAIEKRVAALLAKDNVVARFKGRTEFGARALGNRSILASPKSRETVKQINEMIKNRDFWMPFAASVLSEDQDRYLLNPKKMTAPFMGITFDTTALAHEHLSAAMHPYDQTCRPQIVTKDANPSYHALISEFKNLTGIGAVLNTSFNLHGQPNVESPKDAIETLSNSGLQYLALENFLISKKS